MSGKGVDMEDLVRAQLAHLADLMKSRSEAFGPKLRLNASAAQAIGPRCTSLRPTPENTGLSMDSGHVD
jgi:hypothetical protein